MRTITLPAAIAVAVAALLAGCAGVQGRYPSDVQAALASHAMRRLETDQLIVYYPAARRDDAHRFAAHVDRCAAELRAHARVASRQARAKMVVVVPEVPFNNAYVMPPALGLGDVAVVPATNTLDFTTLYGLPPDPAHIGCHEITHYVHLMQIAGLWGLLNTGFGDLVSPQVGLDPWFIEGLATYYEARLQRGGRPRWPVFTGMFHAAYAGGDLGGGDLSEHKRLAAVGHHYLVGAMFIEFLAETYGEAALWRVIEAQAYATLIVTSVSGRFDEVYGKGLGDLIDDFRVWVARRFPVRARPAGERIVHRLGTDARWAWSPTGDVAIVDRDVDRPTRLTVLDAHGRVRDRRNLTDLLAPRQLAIAAPILISGMSFAGDGTLWLTAVDLGGTYQTTRLLRWRDGDLDEVARGLGPGGTILADGRAYVHMIADGARWSLARRDLTTGATRILWTAPPGQYAIRVQASADGARLAVSAWDGARFVVWIVDATTGARLAELLPAGRGSIYDATFAPDGRVVVLDEVDGRFQVAIAEADGARRVVTDAPYGALEPRVVGDRLRFLARDGWRWTLDEVALPPPVPPPARTPWIARVLTTGPTPPAPAPAHAPDASPPSVASEAPATTAPPLRVHADEPYSRLDGLFRPTLHALAFVVPAAGVNQLGLNLSGGDRLDLIRYSAAAFVDLDDTRKISFTGGVLLNDLAPWRIFAGGTRYHYTATDFDAPVGMRDDFDREWRTASASIGRTWRDTYALSLGGTYAYDRRGATRFRDQELLRLYGPDAHLTYAAVEATPYTGVRRGLVVTADGAYFPRPAGEITDLRGQLDVTVPLPLLRRHVVTARVRGHALVGPGVDEPLLEVGGLASGVDLWTNHGLLSDTDTIDPGDGVLPFQRRFAEPVRGFEDLRFATNRAAIGDLTWRYPLIIDRGLPNLWFLPASFVHQLDLELFGAGAALRPDAARYHLAAGGAVTLRLTVFRIPLALQYQASRRLTDDETWFQLVSLRTAP